MLELVHRTYNDEQLEQSIRDISSQIVDKFSASLEKGFWISEFERVQQDIMRARVDRKMKTKLLAGTLKGQQIIAKKRLHKNMKKKEKEQERLMKYRIFKDK